MVLNLRHTLNGLDELDRPESKLQGPPDAARCPVMDGLAVDGHTRLVRHSCRALLAVGLLAASGCTPTWHRITTLPDTAEVYFPFGLADLSRHVAFVEHPDHDRMVLEAIELDSGKRRWLRGRELQPLALWHGRLYAADTSHIPPRDEATVQIVQIDEATGRTLRVLGTIASPDWANDVETHARLEGDRLVVAWTARVASSWDGMPTPPNMRDSRWANGTLAFELPAGRAVPANAPALPQKAAALAKSQRALVPELHPVPFVTDGVVVVAIVEEHRVVLHRWQAATGSPLPSIDVKTPWHADSDVTPDGRYLVVTYPSARGSHVMHSVFELATGRLHATFANANDPDSYALPSLMFFWRTVNDPNPPGYMGASKTWLSAVDVATGKQVWRRRLFVSSPEFIPP